MKINKITIVGAGYVGTSLSLILSMHHSVKILEVDKAKVSLINSNKSPINEHGINKFIKTNNLDLTATNNNNEAYTDADYIIIAIPTDFDEDLNSFDTKSLETVIEDINTINPKATIVIKSTIPIGFTKKQNLKYQRNNIIFSPEFLREGSTIEDNLNPSRIVLGGEESFIDSMKDFASILKSCSVKNDVKILFMDSAEAEAVKLFSNAYLAMRVSFFNELDSFALSNKLKSANIIAGVSADNRIGDFYNNPSFGYGGYCLPKDTKQLLSNFNQIPQNIIKSIVSSNETRKDFIADIVNELEPDVIGVYRLIMKENSTNYRNSAILDIVKTLKDKGNRVIIFEPLIDKNLFMDCEVLNDIELFKIKSSIILANRHHDDLNSVNNKVFSRDLFNTDS